MQSKSFSSTWRRVAAVQVLQGLRLQWWDQLRLGEEILVGLHKEAEICSR